MRENVPLAPLTTFRIGGPARYFVEAREERDVEDALAFAGRQHLPLFVLGGGSNILVSDEGFPGMVLHMAIRGVSEKQQRGRIALTAGAGEDWDPIVAEAVRRSLGGIECLSGIPGTVGGTPVQNVGAYGQEVSETIAAVRAFDHEQQRLLELSNAECGFSYRRSIFNTTARDRYIVVSVTYALPQDGVPALRYADVQKHFAGAGRQPSLLEVREAVRAIRANKSMLLVDGDPDARSAGSFFKNPIITEPDYRRLSGIAPSPVPRFPVPGEQGLVKLAAAWLIEHAGFSKGYIRGRAGISSRHTLALVNRGGATAADVIALMREIQAGVRARFGIELHPEPLFIGFCEPIC